MKSFLAQILWIFPLLIGVADGGYTPRYSIHCYEPTYNVLYMGISDTVQYTQKNKTREAYVMSNVAIYDIANDKVEYIFSDQMKHNIVAFEFESNYIEVFNTVEFNNEGSYDSYKEGIFQHANNKNVALRPISNNLIIVTQDPHTYKHVLWICDKLGKNLRKEAEFASDWTWEIDVKNKVVRLFRQLQSKIEIKNIKY